MVKFYDFLKDETVSRQIDDTILMFLPEECDRKHLSKLKRDIWKSRELYLINPNEYFLYEFENLSDAERHEFVGNREKELLCTKLNKNGAWKIFMDKWETYKRFGEYFGREVICIRNEEDRNLFEEFCKKHKWIIVKVNNSSQGRGIFIADVDTVQRIYEVFGKILCGETVRKLG